MPETPPADIAGLVTAARDGDAGAFAQLYARFARAVHGLLLARVPAADADDLVQEVFLHAWTRLKDLREPEAFGGWLCAAARRRAVDYHRRSTPVGELHDVHASRERPDVTAEAVAALKAIQALPEAYRETLALRLVEGLSGPEIAEATGLTPGSVRINLHRGFKLLRERLGAHP